jgi:hypothetical protein
MITARGHADDRKEEAAMRWCAAAGVAFLLLLPHTGIPGRRTLEERSRSPVVAGLQAAVRRVEWVGGKLRLVYSLRWAGEERLFKVRKGLEALEERFDACGLSYWGPLRASAV